MSGGLELVFAAAAAMAVALSSPAAIPAIALIKEKGGSKRGKLTDNIHVEMTFQRGIFTGRIYSGKIILSEFWKPTRDPLEIFLIRRAKLPLQRRFFVEHDKQVRCQPGQGSMNQ